MGIFQNVAAGTHYYPDNSERIAEIKRALPPGAKAMLAHHRSKIDKLAAEHFIRQRGANRVRARRDELISLTNMADRDEKCVQNYTKQDQAIADAMRSELAECRAELLRLQEPIKPKPPTLPRGLHQGGFDEFFATISRNQIFVDAPAEMNLAKIETPIQSLDKARAKVNDALVRHKATRLAPLPFEDALAQATSDIERMADDGQIKFANCFKNRQTIDGEQQRGIEWPTQTFDTGSLSGHLLEFHDSLPVLVWMFKDQFIARATAELKAADQPDRSLSFRQRKLKQEEIEQEIIEAERREVALCCLCEDSGLEVEWRNGIHPLAFLQAAIAITEPAAAKTGDFG